MRHRKRGKKFNHKGDVKKAFIRSLIIALMKNKKIKTTETRAKTVRSMTERYISIAKKGDLASVKRLHSYFSDLIVDALKEIAKKYQDRGGGYIRISKIIKRSSDKAKMSVVEFV